MRRTLVVLMGTLALLLAACGQQQSPDVIASDTVPDGGASIDDGAAAGDAETEGSDEAASVTDEAGGAMTVEPAAGTLRSGLLARALDPEAPVSSARFEGRIEVTGAPGSELPGTFTMSYSGAYDLAAEASDVTIDLSDMLRALAAAETAGPEDRMAMEFMAGFFEEPMRVITIGDTSWIRWGVLGMMTGTEGAWLETAAEDGAGAMTGDFGFGGSGHPTDVLDALADAEAQVETLGTEEIRGVTTTRYRAVVDLAKLAETMSAAEQAEFEAEMGATPTGPVPMEFWLDDAGQLHRFRMEIDAAAVGETDDEFESVVLLFEMWDHGVDVGITPPPADQVVTEDDIDFGLDFGDLEG